MRCPEALPDPSRYFSHTHLFNSRRRKLQHPWITPEFELELCGHATLAAGYVIFNHLTATIAASFSTP